MSRYVPSTAVIGSDGHSVSRGYTEIGGLRFYDDQVVVGPYGEHMLDRGGVETAAEKIDQFRPVSRPMRGRR